MEPTQAKVRHVINTVVTSVEEHFNPCYVSGFGADAKFDNVSQGWFVYLAGSYEAIHLGKDKPDLVKGDKIKIMIEKVEDAQV